jgi:C1A family cysteine protease
LRQLSAFFGHPLEAVARAGGPVSAALVGVGISDAEQLVAAAAVEGMREHLAEHLEISRQAMETIVRQAKKAVPPQALGDLEHPVPPPFGLGALEPTPQMKARAAELGQEVMAVGAVGLPSAVNLISKMPPVRNQSVRSTCVAFTLTAVHEYLKRVKGAPEDDLLSEQHLYCETKLIDGAPNQKGTWQSWAARALADRGECREVIWPYNPNPPDTGQPPPPAQAREDGLNYRLQLQQLSARSVSAIQSALASRRPVGISIPVYNSWFQSSETRRSGRITLRIGNEPQAGGHAVCLVGYQDEASAPGGGYFILRNSWGAATWGYQCPYGGGYGTIPYQYIANDNWEAFTLQEAVEPPPAEWQLLFTADLAGRESHRWYQEGWDPNIAVEFRVKPRPPHPPSAIEMDVERFVEADGSVTYYFDIVNRSSSSVTFAVEYAATS